jgi:hypothetical protein
LVPEHWPHDPPGWQAGVVPPHSESVAQARHVCVVVLHTGLLPPHSVSARHGTHVAVGVKHTGVAPTHLVAFVAEHWAQPPLPWQAGVALGHSASEPQARQVCDAVLQTGVVPPHCALEVHGTQVALAVSQAGVAPEQAVAFVAEHWPQAPLAPQAGFEPEHSESPAQARQAWVVVLQTGAVPTHWAFEVQGTQVPLVVKQTGVAPEQAAAFVAEHWPQDPAGWHAGVAPPHSESPAQARQVWVVVLQTGIAPPH